jgi:hypothetical protein
MRVLESLIANYGYQAARTYIQMHTGDKWLPIRALLDMQQSRLSFDFADAAGHWARAKETIPADLLADPLFSRTGELFAELANGADARAQELALITELVRQLELYLDVEDTASFLIRFYRAREAVLTYIARDYGVERVKTGSIHALFTDLERALEQATEPKYLGAYFFWKSKNVTDTMDLRNRSFIGHGRNGFSEQRVWEEYSGYAMQSVPIAKRRFIRDAALMLRDLGAQHDDHIERVNSALLQLVQRTGGALAELAPETGESRNAICRQLVIAGLPRAVLTIKQPKPASELARVLQFAEHLQNAHFVTLKADLPLVMDILTRHRADAKEVAYCRDMLVLERREQRAFIQYLYSLAQLYDEREMMVDFVVVYFRLVEELMLYTMGWDVDGQQRLVPGKYRKPMRLREGERIATFAVFRRILAQRDPGDAAADAVWATITRPEVADVLELRHEGVSGHGFADLSRDRVLALSGGKEPLKWLEPLLERFELVPAYSIFRLVDEAALLLLD